LKTLHKDIIILLILDLLILGSGYLLRSVTDMVIFYSDICILTILFSIISFVSLYIFHRGQTKEPDSQTLHTLVAMSTKFLFEMILALIWFIVIKKTSRQSVLIFFVLYLTITLFLVWNILKALKNKSL